LKGLDTTFTGIYAILVSLWVTLMMERWKRKSAEISMKWGIYNLKNDTNRIVRQEFYGDE
jgi:hypothetical protein